MSLGARAPPKGRAALPPPDLEPGGGTGVCGGAGLGGGPRGRLREVRAAGRDSHPLLLELFGK